jgi:hypothetical protein
MSESTSGVPSELAGLHDLSGPRVSVRGTASRVVPPDLCSWNLTVVAVADVRADSIAAVGQAQQALEVALTGLGGSALSVDTMLHPMTWSARSMQTYDDYDFDKMTGQQRTTHGLSPGYRSRSPFGTCRWCRRCRRLWRSCPRS